MTLLFKHASNPLCEYFLSAKSKWRTRCEYFVMVMLHNLVEKYRYYTFTLVSPPPTLDSLGWQINLPTLETCGMHHFSCCI